eukprot:1155037-Pelagomonas_calceolata.AAC.10
MQQTTYTLEAKIWRPASRRMCNLPQVNSFYIAITTFPRVIVSQHIFPSRVQNDVEGRPRAEPWQQPGEQHTPAGPQICP